MRLDLSADELLSTTRAVRKRLDFDRPVELSVIRECLELAVQAPTGSNWQGWRFVVVTDPATKATIAEYYLARWNEYYSPMEREPRSDEAKQLKRVMTSADYLAHNFARVPVMVIPCIVGRFDGADHQTAAGALASIYPATWSFMLAARERGLGTVLTTLHLAHEREVAELLEIPFDEVAQTALIPVAYTKGTDFRPATRPPIESVSYLDSWGSEPDFGFSA